MKHNKGKAVVGNGEPRPYLQYVVLNFDPLFRRVTDGIEHQKP